MIPAVNKNPSHGDLRTFGYVMLVGFWILGVLLWCAPWIKSRDVLALSWTASGLQIAALALQGLGIVLCTISLATPAVTEPVYIVWMTIARAMGLVTSTILMTVLFVFFLPVFSLIVRFGDPMRKRLGGQETYWEDAKPYEATLERMQRAF